MKQLGAPGRLACKILKDWAHRCPPLVSPTIPLVFEAPSDDLVAVAFYGRATEAAEKMDFELLVSLLKEDWQQPMVDGTTVMLNVAPFRKAGKGLIEAGRVDDAFALGSKLKNCNGVLITSLIGISLCILARHKGYKVTELADPDQEFRRIALAELRRFIIPNIRSAFIGDDEEEIELADWFRCRGYSQWIRFGGMDTGNDLIELERLTRELETTIEASDIRKSISAMAVRTAPFVPSGVLRIPPDPVTILRWTVQQKVRPTRLDHPLARESFASVCAVLNGLSYALNREHALDVHLRTK